MATSVHGDKGSVQASRDGCEVFNEELEGAGGSVWLPYPEADLSEYAQEMEAFADYVAGTYEGLTTGRSENLIHLAIVQAGYESMQSGQAVDLHKRFGALD